jgi:hypothetical protein
VVALLDGRPDDAEVVDVALAECVRLERDLRMIHLYGSGVATTPLADAFAREYAQGAMVVAGLVPEVGASAVAVPRGPGALRCEFAGAGLVVAPADMGLTEVTLRGRARGRPRVIRVPGVRNRPRLRYGYRLALVRELDRGERADGATTPEALDDAWHVGVACPALSEEAIRAWSACAAWPPLTVAAGR